MEWEKIFANDMTDKGLISKIYKQLMELRIKKNKNKIKSYMFWYNVISHNSSYYFKMYISEITKFPCQLHYYELSSNLKKKKTQSKNGQRPEETFFQRRHTDG